METAILNEIEPSPEQLARQAQGGRTAAFESLVERFQSRVFNFILRAISHQADAEDLTQETFIKAYRSLPGYDERSRFVTWLFVIARRTVVDHFRRRRPVVILPLEAAEETPGPADPAAQISARDRSRSLWAAAQKLPAKQNEALWLRYGEDLSIAEVARVMQTNQIHVKVLLHRARQQMARLLGDSEP